MDHDLFSALLTGAAWLGGGLVGIIAWLARSIALNVRQEMYSMKNDIATNGEAVAGLLGREEQYKGLPSLVSQQATIIAGMNATIQSINNSVNRIEGRIDRALDGHQKVP